MNHKDLYSEIVDVPSDVPSVMTLSITPACRLQKVYAHFRKLQEIVDFLSKNTCEDVSYFILKNVYEHCAMCKRHHRNLEDTKPSLLHSQSEYNSAFGVNGFICSELENCAVLCFPFTEEKDMYCIRCQSMLWYKFCIGHKYLD